MTKKYSSMSAFEIAKELGIGYTGDCNVVDHDGTFYETLNWERYGYSECVRFFRVSDDGDRLYVECATINRPDDLTDCYRCCGFDLIGGLLHGNGQEPFVPTPEVEIECTLAYWGVEVVEDFGGPYVQKFDDGTDEDKIWEAVSDWMNSLRGEQP